MKTASPGNITTTSISRLAIASIVMVLVAFAAPNLRAETPADQIKAAGAIPLTTDVLDKMDKAVKALTADADAKAELTAMPNDPGATPESLAAAISAKCPKAAADFKSAGIAPEDFLKGVFAIMACAMSDDMAKSSDKAAAANAAFVTANKDKCEAVFGGFMQLSMPAEPSSSPSTP